MANASFLCNLNLQSSSKQEKRDSELADKRADWDSQRESNFEKLRSYAKTEEQKQAVEEYIVTITEAIKTRRDANDIAFATFRKDLEALKSTASQSAEVNVSATVANINQAVTTAKTACEAGQSADIVKQTLKTDIASARQQSKNTRESVTKGQQLKAITAKRNDAVKANNNAFNTATKEAREKLKAVFNG